jgi:hypothetical protein
MNEFQLNRRQALIASGLGTLSLGMPGVVMGSDKVDAAGKAVASDKSCIFVLLCGGPSHVDTWDIEARCTAGLSRTVRTNLNKSAGHAHQ